VVPDVPERLEAICMKALSPEPSRRLAPAAEVESELLEYLDGCSSRGSNRELGKYVSALFADTRQKTKTLIEQQLAKLDAADSSSIDIVALPNDLALVERTETPAGAVITASRPPRTSPTRRTLAAAVAGAAVVGLAIAGGLRASAPKASVATTPQPAMQAPAQSSELLAPPAPAPFGASPSIVSIVLSATPASAKLYLDGEPLKSNPARREAVPDSARHQLRATALGYQERTIEVTLDRDQQIVVALDRSFAAPGSWRPHAAAVQDAPPPAPSPAQPAPPPSAPAPSAAPTKKKVNPFLDRE
jgi:serine/threonine-protein kinase